MKESIGGAQVLLISITILLIAVIVLSASIGYTKAFKARNGIINIVQKYAKYNMNAETVVDYADEEIDKFLNNLGYMLNAGSGRSCESSSHYQDYPKGEHGDYVADDNNRDSSKIKVLSVAKGRSFNYCIFQYEDEKRNQYYGIETYMYFELPVFGRNDRFVFPIYGNTKTLFNYGSEILPGDLDPGYLNSSE